MYLTKTGDNLVEKNFYFGEIKGDNPPRVYDKSKAIFLPCKVRAGEVCELCFVHPL